MQSIPGEFETALKRGYAVEGESIVVGEWNYNNLFNVTVTNPPDDQGWILNKQLFPANAVVSGFRPKNGIFYGITDESFTDGSTTGLDANRYYTIDDINKYKYWVCPTPSTLNPPLTDEGTVVDPNYTVDRGTLLLDYGQFLNMNKVSATFNFGPIPTDWSLWVFEQVSNSWIEINNPLIDEITGQAEVWWNGTAWVQTQQLDEAVYQKISMLKLEVRAVAEPGKRLQVVEVSGRREVELTSRTEEYSINASMDNQDFIYPVGKMAANDGNIIFNNNDLKMDHQNPASDFYGALVGWCQYRTYVVYDLTPWSGAAEYTVKTSTMYANDFEQQNEWQYNVQLFDVLKILQTIDCPALLIEGQSLARVIATLLDMVGVDTYNFEFADWDTTNTVKYFWTDGTEKVFDVLSRLVESFQAALFVDEDGIIRLLTRNDITPADGETSVWTFRGDQQGLDLPDIQKLDKKYALQINKLNIKYTKRQAKVDDLDITEQPLTTTVWESSDAVVLRAAPVVRTMLADDISAIPYRMVDGLAEWTPHSCTLALSYDHAPPISLAASQSGKIVPVGTPTTVSIESNMVNAPLLGQIYASANIWLNSNVSSNFSLSVKWFDANKAYMSTTDNWISLTAGAWRFVENTFTVPVNAKYATMVPIIRASPSQTWYVDVTSLRTPGFPDNFDIWIGSSNAENWPYAGKVNIDGEVIEYSGKAYAWWDYTDGTPVYRERMIYSADEKKALDRSSYQSWITGSGATQIVGGVSPDPTKQNHFVGRLRPIVRDVEKAGQQKIHPQAQGPGWYTMDFWTQKSNSNSFPTKWFTPGGGPYNLANLKDWDKKTGWTQCQTRVTINNSIATIDNVTNNSMVIDKPTHATILVRDQGDTDFREIGTRLRIRGGTKGRAIIPFYMTNLPGYDNENPPNNEVFNSTRCYILNVCTSEYADSIDRSRNEIWLDYKDGATLYRVFTGGQGGDAGKIKIDADKWYDIDIVFRDGAGELLEGGGFYGARPAVEVYVDGAYTDTWYPGGEWSIRPTSLIGIGAKDTTIVDFEYLYGSTTTNKGRFAYSDNSLFDAVTLQLPAGTNVEKSIELPIGNDWLGSGTISFATWGANATIQNLQIKRYNSSYVVSIAPQPAGLTLKPDQRMVFELDDIMPDHGILKLKYTSTNPISLCIEFSRARNFPYGIDNEPIPPIENFYDRLKGGYTSSKFDETMYTPPKYAGTQFASSNITTPIFLNYFYEDFGSIVHEIRDFKVDLDTAPAKGISVYSSNEHAKVIDFKYNPVKGIFTMVNTSHKDEIVNGTEQVDDSNSIDHALLLYGYALESKGEDTETVTNDLSILRHGIIAQDLDATWIFTKEEAKALGQWVTTHWGDSMDTITLETFCSTFIQIGDKINIYYPNANIDSNWMFVVTDKSTSFNGNGLSTVITVRRVR